MRIYLSLLLRARLLLPSQPSDDWLSPREARAIKFHSLIVRRRYFETKLERVQKRTLRIRLSFTLSK